MKHLTLFKLSNRSKSIERCMNEYPNKKSSQTLGRVFGSRKALPEAGFVADALARFSKKESPATASSAPSDCSRKRGDVLLAAGQVCS
eukprot:3222651-Amphidinium_carterae.1